MVGGAHGGSARTPQPGAPAARAPIEVAQPAQGTVIDRLTSIHNGRLGNLLNQLQVRSSDARVRPRSAGRPTDGRCADSGRGQDAPEPHQGPADDGAGRRQWQAVPRAAKGDRAACQGQVARRGPQSPRRRARRQLQAGGPRAPGAHASDAYAVLEARGLTSACVQGRRCLCAVLAARGLTSVCVQG